MEQTSTVRKLKSEYFMKPKSQLLTLIAQITN